MNDSRSRRESSIEESACEFAVQLQCHSVLEARCREQSGRAAVLELFELRPARPRRRRRLDTQGASETLDGQNDATVRSRLPLGREWVFALRHYSLISQLSSSYMWLSEKDHSVKRVPGGQTQCQRHRPLDYSP